MGYTQTVALSLVEVSVGIATAVLAAVAWRYRDSRVGRLVVVMAVAASSYSFATAALSFIDNRLLWLLLNNIGYPLGAVLAVSSLLIVAEFTDWDWLRRPAVGGALGGFVTLDFIVAMTDPVHNLVIASLARQEGVITAVHGPLFFVHTVLALGIVLVAISQLCLEFPQSSGVHRKQTAILVGALGVGMGGFAVQSFAPVHPAIDLSTVGMLGWCGLVFWGVVTADFLDIVPVGRRQIVRSIEDPVLTLDGDNRVIDSNPAARDLASTGGKWAGTRLSAFFSEYPALVAAIESGDGGQIAIDVDGETEYITLTISPLFENSIGGSGSGKRIGRVVLMRDVTDQIRHRDELELANEQLDRAHERYRSLYENSPLVFWEWNLAESMNRVSRLADREEFDSLAQYLAQHPDEQRELIEAITVRNVNRNAVEAYGATSKTELADNLDALFADEARAAHGQLLERLFEGERQFTEEVTFRTFEGERRHELLEVCVPDDHGAAFSRVLVMATDITERKEREEELRYRKALFEALNESTNAGVLVTSTDREILWYNSRFQEMWEIPTDILETDRASERATDYVLEKVVDAEAFRRATEELYEPPYEEEKEEIKLVDGRWFERFTAPIVDGDGRQYGLLTLTRDITDRKQYEMKIEAQNQRLERLAKVISHDMQTPLSTAEKHLRLLEIELDDPEEPVTASLNDLETTHDRLYRFAEHLPRLARESTEVEGTVECSVAAVARDAWDVVESESLDLVIDGDQTLQADRRRLRQLFENLFANVRKHGVEATTVWVDTHERGFSVADDGPGVSEEQGDEIFEYGMSTADGSGIGLAIVRSIAEAHGWEIAVSTSDAGGAKFTVRTS